MPPWQRRIQRAQEVSTRHPSASELLSFYIHIAKFQQELHRKFSTIQSATTLDRELSPTELEELGAHFPNFLALVEHHGPKPLAELARAIPAHRDLLASAWIAHSPPDAASILAQAFLQPYAELLRSRAHPRPPATAHALCPFCNRKPALGVLRPMGDGGARHLICSFCLAEWDFRRIVCPGCADENDKHLPVFTASDFEIIRVECCDTCNTYIKTIDLTRDGHAEPIVDELASAPLDLWAREHGYTKLHANLLGM